MFLFIIIINTFIQFRKRIIHLYSSLNYKDIKKSNMGAPAQ